MVQLQHTLPARGKGLITLLRMATFSIFFCFKITMLQIRAQGVLTPLFLVVKLLPTLVCASSRSISFMYDLRLPTSSSGDTFWSCLSFPASKSSSSPSEKSNSSSSSRSSESSSSESAPRYYFVSVQQQRNLCRDLFQIKQQSHLKFCPVLS